MTIPATKAFVALASKNNSKMVISTACIFISALTHRIAFPSTGTRSYARMFPYNAMDSLLRMSLISTPKTRHVLLAAPTRSASILQYPYKCVIPVNKVAAFLCPVIALS